MFISTSETSLKRAEWQRVLFAERPARSELLRLIPEWSCINLRIRVHRNHGFEPIASVMQPYLNFAGWQGSFSLSDYDDSLSLNVDADADIEILWLDYDRYKNSLSFAQLLEWLGERIKLLRAQSHAPILLPSWENNAHQQAFGRWLEEMARNIPGLHACDLTPVTQALGEAYYDQRAARFSGTRLSDRACISTARLLACHWLPAALRPRLKAVLVDLDETLYAGVLGEDGATRVRLTAGHERQQRQLLTLYSQGVFLGLVSRNEEADVARLFETRTDFPLRWEHFSARAIGWGAKSAGIAAIADALRIATDAVVYVDDNPGELAEVAGRLPGIHTVHAHGDADLTARTLHWYPGLWTRSPSETDTVRIADLEASRRRQALQAQTQSPEEYLRSLEVSLGFAIDPVDHVPRLAELSGKTNQFNLNLRRVGATEIRDYIASPHRTVVSIRLRDRLSESGIISLLMGGLDGETLVVDELCISCRALGRGLETLMIAEAVRLMRRKLPGKGLAFAYREGPRNQPARRWLESVCGEEIRLAQGLISFPEEIWGGREEMPVTIYEEGV